MSNIGTTSEDCISPPSNTTPALLTQGSCIHCRRRKVKCDKNSPCSNCTRTGMRCELAPRKRAPRRPKKSSDESGHSDREVELMKRLNKLESVVKSLSGQVAPPSLLAQPDEAGETNREHEHMGVSAIEKDFGTLTISDEGKSRYVSHNFFVRLSEELVDDIVHLMFDYHEDEDVSPPERTESSTETSHQSFIFGYRSSNVNLRDLHPLPSQLPFYLRMYAQRVDTMIKILHIPTTEKMTNQAQDHLDTISRSNEALLFAIYYAVITSMSEEEVKLNFALQKKAATERYRFGIEQALARASFLDTSELVTLQAFVIYLSVVRIQDESRVGLALARSAIAVAQSMGLHRDGSGFGLTPLETELRRRVWWQLLVLDFRNSEKHSTEPNILEGSFDTQRPLNINDADLVAESRTYPKAREGLTEMTVTLISYEISSAVLVLQWSPKETNKSDVGVNLERLEEKEEQLRQFDIILEDKYMKYCTDGSSLALVAATLCKLIVCKLRTIVRLPLARSNSDDEASRKVKDKMFITSIEIVEVRRQLVGNLTKHWHWYLNSIVQWHAIAYLLSELCVREQNENVARAWRILDSVFQDWWDLLLQGTPGLLWAPMKKLIARARHKRFLDFEAAKAAEIATSRSVPLNQRNYCDLEQTLDLGTAYLNINTDCFSSFSRPGDSLGQQHQWMIPPEAPTSGPVPWFLEDKAMQELGLDVTEFDPNMDMDWSSWVQTIQPGNFDNAPECWPIFDNPVME